MSEWQPIETAPKDIPVLLYCPDAVGEKIAPGQFVVPHPDRDYVPHPTVENAFVLEEITYPGSWETTSESYVEPTHWMPLPEPPSEES